MARYMMVYMATHITEAAAAADFPGLMARIRMGEEIVIESDSHPIALLTPAAPRKGRLLSESLAIAEARAKERGFEPVMDADFAADVMERIRNRKPRDTSAWD